MLLRICQIYINNCSQIFKHIEQSVISVYLLERSLLSSAAFWSGLQTSLPGFSEELISRNFLLRIPFLRFFFSGLHALLSKTVIPHSAEWRTSSGDFLRKGTWVILECPKMFLFYPYTWLIFLLEYKILSKTICLFFFSQNFYKDVYFFEYLINI